MSDDLLFQQRGAATRLGISNAEYARHLDAGESWCWDCRTWRSVSLFYLRRGSDVSPAGQCIDCHRVYMREYMRRRYQARRGVGR